jgi:phosphomannomutase/phosphoglucomutase
MPAENAFADRSAFKACDIRGRYGEGIITLEGFRRLGRALGTLAARRGATGPLLVAGDVRPHSAPLRAALAEGLLAAGVDLLEAGTLPTPAVYFAIRHLDAAGGATVTASHNPAPYNGLKFILGRLPVRPDDLAELAGLVRDGPLASGAGTARPVEVLPAYRRHLAALCPRPLTGLRLMVDCGHGCASGLAGPVLNDLGAEVQTLFDRPDGTFPGRHPDAARAENLSALAARVPAAGADLGIAFDGDGDRVSFLTAEGRFAPADQVIALLADDAVRRARAEGEDAPSVVYDIKCSRLVARAVEDAGGRALMEKSGHAFIKRRVLTEQAVLGGEVSGHYFYRRLEGGDDGLYTAWRVADLLQRTGRSLAGLLAGLPPTCITPDLRLPCPPEEAKRLLDALAAAHAANPTLCRLDGLRAEFDDGWALLRPSITEPAVTFRFESASPEGLARVVDAFLAELPSWREKIHNDMQSLEL